MLTTQASTMNQCHIKIAKRVVTQKSITQVITPEKVAIWQDAMQYWLNAAEIRLGAAL